MKINNKSFLIDYLILSTALTIGVWLFYFYIGMPDTQYLLAKFLAIYYVLWGAIHHYHKGDFHLKIMVEYLVIAVLSLLIVRGVIYH